MIDRLLAGYVLITIIFCILYTLTQLDNYNTDVWEILCLSLIWPVTLSILIFKGIKGGIKKL